MNRLLPLLGLVVVATAAWLALGSPAPRAPTQHVQPEARAEAPRGQSEQVERERLPVRAERARYALTYRVVWQVDGTTQAPIEIAALWDTTPSADGQQVRISAVKITDHPALPAAAALEGVYGVHADAAGTLRRFTWPTGADTLTRRTFATLAATFWLTEAEGAAWTADEEDPAGVFHAQYRRTGEAIEKSVERWIGVRGPQGLDAGPVATMKPGGVTRFELDDRGLRRVTVDTTLLADAGEGAPKVETHITAELRRLDDTPPAFAGVEGHPGDFNGLVDYSAQRAENDAQLVDGASVADLLAAAREAERLGRKTREGRQATSLALRQMSALVRLEPAAAQTIADAARRRAADGEPIGLLTGALASAREPAATDALAGLIEHLPADQKRNAINTLGLAHEPTTASLETLAEALEGPDADAAAMALGNQARQIADTAPEEATSAVDALLARYAAATTVAEKALCLQALANTGDRRALPAMLAAIESGDMVLRPLGIDGLRFIPGDDVDAALEPWLLAGNQGAREALSAIRYRAPARWRAPLEQARTVYSRLGDPGADFVQAIDALLAA